MKRQLTLLFFSFCFSFALAQNTNYQEYSYTEFFELIENEKDSVFKLKDALIKYNPETDIRFKVNSSPEQTKDEDFVYKNDIVIDKHIELNNVQFKMNFGGIGNFYVEGVLSDIHFKKTVKFQDVKSFNIQYCRFDQKVDYTLTNCEVGDQLIGSKSGDVYILDSDFETFVYNSLCDDASNTSYYIYGNNFRSSGGTAAFIFYLKGTNFFVFERNTIVNDNLIFFGLLENSGRILLRDNVFDSEFIHISKTNFDGQLRWTNNKHTTPVFLELDPFSSGDEIHWDQFDQGFTSSNSFIEYTLKEKNRFPIRLTVEDRKILSQKFIDSVRVFDEDAFSEEMSIKSQFYNHFKSRYNTQKANDVYINLKDFETQRLKVIHDENPGFRSYFKWKVNQFLKLFSDYGTEPSKAIVFSMYVIIFFAIIYLFFPNSWDRHGKNRIMDRYRFFLKYVNKNAGIHEVYLDEKKPELLDAEDFKTYLLQQGKTAPKFFTSTALPLYRWSIAGTKTFSWLLSKIDILKGTWSETSPSKQKWKSVLIFLAFFFAIVYDIFIKILNALMLSINTFTTLGFGEIPIKGLPRYLAIIQGFIGWFMLTIFSVSLISQLLN